MGVSVVSGREDSLVAIVEAVALVGKKDAPVAVVVPPIEMLGSVCCADARNAGLLAGLVHLVKIKRSPHPLVRHP